jgi:hypothetical protein
MENLLDTGIYSILDSNTRQIRLATLAAGSGYSERPTCELSVASLDDKPSYKVIRPSLYAMDAYQI